MREPYQPPTPQPALRITTLLPPCHSREGGNPPRCIHTPEETTLLPPSTKFDKTRQNSTRFYRNSCPPARARQPAVSFPRHGLFPGRSEFDVPLGSAVPIAAMPINQTEPDIW